MRGRKRRLLRLLPSLRIHAPFPCPVFCCRLSLSRAHPALREAASQQGFEGETVKVEWLSVQELETLAASARRNRGALLPVPLPAPPAPCANVMPHCSLLCPAAQLNVVAYGDTAGLSLAALHGTRVVTVDMRHCEPPPLDTLSGFSELRELDLTRCDMLVVPPALSGLTALEDLNLWGNEQLGQEGGGLEQLATLTRLRSLKLGSCSLRAVPPALSGLTALEHLDLSYNDQLGEEDNSLERLAALTRLRSLASDCTLCAVPPALSCLTALEDLDLDYNWQLEDGLRHLHALPALRGVTLPHHLFKARLRGLQASMPGVQFTMGQLPEDPDWGWGSQDFE